MSPSKSTPNPFESPKTPPAQPLAGLSLPVFISPQVLERLSRGEFVPKRTQNRRNDQSRAVEDRRNSFSPLAITKRCLPYEPLVFETRPTQVLQLAQALNSVDKKIILLTGAQGLGKGALMRAVVELMGGGPEQLLWFEASAQTDFAEVSSFFIQATARLALHLQPTLAQQVASVLAHPHLNSTEQQRAFEPLEQALELLSGVPLLLVLNHVEPLVDAQERLQSPLLKQALNFFLSFDNVKVALLGERQPYTDLKATQDVTLDLTLQPLSEKSWQPWLKTRQNLNQATPENLSLLFDKAKGAPWLLKTLLGWQKWLQLNPNQSLELAFWAAVQQAPAHAPLTLPKNQLLEAVLELFLPVMTEPERVALALLAAARQPVPLTGLQSLVSTVLKTPVVLSEAIKTGVSKPLYRQNVPPQYVLEHLAQSQSQAQAPIQDVSSKPMAQKPIAVYMDLPYGVKTLIYTGLLEEEKAELHAQWYHYWEACSKQPPSVFHPVDVSLKEAKEARYHRDLARKHNEAFDAQSETPINARPWLSGWDLSSSGLEKPLDKPASSLTVEKPLRVNKKRPFLLPRKTEPEGLQLTPAEAAMARRLEQNDPVDLMSDLSWALQDDPDWPKTSPLPQAQQASVPVEVKPGSEGFAPPYFEKPNAELLFTQAEAAEESQQWERAMALYQQALALDREAGQWASAAASGANLGRLYTQLDRLEQALTYWGYSVEDDERAANPAGQLVGLSQQAWLLQRLGQTAQAYAVLTQTLALAQKIKASPALVAQLKQQRQQLQP